ncbi:hypothetical protein A6R68_08387, partial [Neotoma lepida]
MRATLQNLMKKMSQYYQSMETHMTPALFVVTIEVMNSIKFWPNICDEKIDLAIKVSKRQQDKESPHSTQQALCQGSPVVKVSIHTQTLAKNDENDSAPGYL